MPFDPFRRFRPRSRQPPSPDSDESSVEPDQPRIIHVLAKSPDRLLDNTKVTTDRSGEGTHIALTLDKASHPDRTSKPPNLGATTVTLPTDPPDSLHSTMKQTLIRRVTSKLNITIPSRSGTQALHSRPTYTASSVQGPRSSKATLPVSPTLPNSFISKQHREAALRERGLLHKDLSEQEREADERLACAPSPVNLSFGGTTEAERLKANWLAVNQSSESSHAERGPSAHPYSPSTGPTSVSPDSGVARRLGEGKTDVPPAGRPSFCSSLPPLSASSCLEVLHEEPWEQGPITPSPPISPARLPIIISNPLDSPSSAILVESPVSCAFSSHCARSTLESPQSGYPPPVPEKDSVRLPAPRRTSDSYDRPRKTLGLSRLGTHSLTNLRRSVLGSMKMPSTSTLSTGDHSSSSIVPVSRPCIEPTMHSIGSILKETRDIKDAESRRLSEIAFLD